MVKLPPFDSSGHELSSSACRISRVDGPSASVWAAAGSSGQEPSVSHRDGFFSVGSSNVLKAKAVIGDSG